MRSSRQPTDIRIWVGKRIRDLRLKQKWTQDMLAAHAGLHRVFISELEHGHKAASIVVLERVAKALEVSLDEFFNGS